MIALTCSPLRRPLAALCLLLPFAVCATEYAPGLYNPTAETFCVQEIHPEWAPEWGYNHDADIVYFKGQWIAAWNGNETSDNEAMRPGPLGSGQYNYISYSKDLKEWTRPVKAFGTQSGSINPIDAWHQWQPNFIKVNDDLLLCAWSYNGTPVISSSADGKVWTNREYPAGQGRKAFPTGNGLITDKGTLLFPVSMLPFPPQFSAALRSTDGGKTWHMSGMMRSASLEAMGVELERIGGPDYFPLWEPNFFQLADGRIGCIVRNLGHREEKLNPYTGQTKSELYTYKTTDNYLLYCESADDGLTWTEARPVQLETVSSRPWSATLADGGYVAVLNDWLGGIPGASYDRFYLSLFVSAVPEPDLLVPGPLVQPAGGLGSYPNAVIDGNTLVSIFSYGTNPQRGITASRLPLPDFSQPFLMPRQGRGEPVILREGEAFFPDASSTLYLVLNKEAIKSESVTIRFRVRVDNFVFHSRLPLLTLGGVSEGRLDIFVDGKRDLHARSPKGSARIGRIPATRFLACELTLDRDKTVLSVEGLEPVTLPAVLRKIAFGGAYAEQKVFPSSTNFTLGLDDLRVITSER